MQITIIETVGRLAFAGMIHEFNRKMKMNRDVFSIHAVISVLSGKPGDCQSLLRFVSKNSTL